MVFWNMREDNQESYYSLHKCLLAPFPLLHYCFMKSNTAPDFHWKITVPSLFCLGLLVLSNLAQVQTVSFCVPDLDSYSRVGMLHFLADLVSVFLITAAFDGWAATFLSWLCTHTSQNSLAALQDGLISSLSNIRLNPELPKQGPDQLLVPSPGPWLPDCSSWLLHFQFQHLKEA
jgi:hypothetical protein